ncbi:MAG TPA: hypothetical protein VFV15_06415 [Moraxellaceae bacterium]|nr:hypothetical protein [Moraxellaceae bacterium]
MKALTHCLWLALAACGSSDHATGPAATGVDTATLQKTKAAEVCPTDGGEGRMTLPDGSIALCAGPAPVTAPFAPAAAGASGG